MYRLPRCSWRKLFVEWFYFFLDFCFLAWPRPICLVFFFLKNKPFIGKIFQVVVFGFSVLLSIRPKSKWLHNAEMEWEARRQMVALSYQRSLGTSQEAKHSSLLTGHIGDDEKEGMRERDTCVTWMLIKKTHVEICTVIAKTVVSLVEGGTD